MKKFILALGSVAAIAAPMTAVIACSEDSKVNEELKPGDAGFDWNDTPNEEHDHEHIRSENIQAGLNTLDYSDITWVDKTTGIRRMMTNDEIGAKWGVIKAFNTVTLTIAMKSDGNSENLVKDDVMTMTAVPIDGYMYDDHRPSVTVDITVSGELDHDGVKTSLEALTYEDVVLADYSDGPRKWRLFNDSAEMMSWLGGRPEFASTVLSVTMKSDGDAGAISNGDILTLKALPADGYAFDNGQTEIIVDMTVEIEEYVAEESTHNYIDYELLKVALLALTVDDLTIVDDYGRGIYDDIDALREHLTTIDPIFTGIEFSRTIILEGLDGALSDGDAIKMLIISRPTGIGETSYRIKKDIDGDDVAANVVTGIYLDVIIGQPVSIDRIT